MDGRRFLVTPGRSMLETKEECPMSLEIDDDAASLGRVLGAIPEIIVLVDRDGVVRYINRVDHGYDRDEVLGLPAESVLFPDSKDRLAAALQTVLATGVSQEYEAEVVTPSGSSVWYQSEMRAYRDGDVIVGAMIIATNITELKQALETVAQLRGLLPICAWCNRIRDEKGSWETLENYLRRETHLDISHGMCPSCYDAEVEAFRSEGAAPSPPERG
jgi:PAS domain S-box-containing protein